MKAPRDLRLRTKGLLVISIPLAALIAVAILFSSLLSSQRQGQRLVEHTLNVRRQIQLVLTLFVDAETAARGYLVSGRPDFLQPLEVAQRALPEELARLRAAVRDDEAQAARAGELEGLARDRLDVITALTADAPGSGVEQQQLEPLLLEGKSLMDRARGLVAVMQQEEGRIEGIRLRALERANRRLQLVLWAGLLGGVLGGLASGIVFLKGILSRVRRLNHNAGLLSEGKPLAELPPAGDEIGQLARRMQAAGELLRAREVDLAAAGEELRRGLSLLRATFDTATDGIAAVDAEGKMILNNQRFLDMFGVPASELAEGGEASVYASIMSRLNDPEGTLAALRPAIATLDAKGCRLVELTSGEVFEVHFHPQRVGDDVVGRVWSVRDVTESHRHRERLERARAEAEQAKEEAESANRAKSDFLSRMSHELRTPLNAILGFGQLLEMDADAPQRQSVNQILKAGRHLLGLINEVLDIARIESGNLSLSIEEVALGEVIAEVLDLVGPIAASAGVTLDGVQPSHAGWKALADRQRLRQVLLNLISNAVKYNVAGGTVRLSGRYTGDATLRLEVTDTGLGIAPENLARLFAPFDRIGAEQSNIEGTGLGLALSKRLVEAMGGTIGVVSSLGRGSTFWIELAPVTADAMGANGQEADPAGLDEGRGESSGATSGSGDPAQRMKLLYIEDNVSNLRLIEQLVERRPEIDLLTAMQGGLGIELARYHRPGLILLDLHLPDMHGADVLDSLRSDPATRAIPVVVLSADATSGQIERLLQGGASDYLTKPLDLQRILEVLDGAMAPKPTSR